MTHSELYITVCKILWGDLDVRGVDDSPEASDEYDCYAPYIAKLVESGCDNYKLTKYLEQIAKMNMGLSYDHSERHKMVADKLLRLLK